MRIAFVRPSDEAADLAEIKKIYKTIVSKKDTMVYIGLLALLQRLIDEQSKVMYLSGFTKPKANRIIHPPKKTTAKQNRKKLNG